MRGQIVVMEEVTKAHHVVPCCHDGFHIKIAREEGYNTVWHNLTIFYQNASKITNNRWIIPHFEPRTNRNLIAPASDDLRGIL